MKWTFIEIREFLYFSELSLKRIEDDPNMIYIGWNMMGFSTFIYLTSNINEQAARWPEKESGIPHTQ